MFEHQLHAYLRALAGAQAPRIGPFTALLDPHQDGRYFNYAVPDDGADPTPEEVGALVAAFTSRSRIPRLEFLPAACPRAEPALLAAGFTPEGRLPVLTCDPHGAAPPVTDGSTQLLLATSERELWQTAEAQNAAYGQATTSHHDVDRLRRVRERGGLVALARDPASGREVGGAQLGPPHHGVSELAAVGVRDGYRRRGVGAALTALLTASCPAAGISTPFLMTLGEAEERMYVRAGYRRRTEMLHLSR